MSETKRSDWPWGNVLNFDDEQKPDAHSSIPDVHIREEENSYEIEIEAPELDKKDFDLFAENNLLTVSASRQMNTDKHDSVFSRSFNIPVNTNQACIQAQYTDGVLRISLPKTTKPDTKSKRSIEIS